MDLNYFIYLFIIINLILLPISFMKCAKGKADDKMKYLFFLGIFAWGDGLIFPLFWIVLSFIYIFNQNLYLLLTFVSAFWLIRSLGETIYWFNEQFASIHINKAENLTGYKLVKDNSIYFIYQIIWQIVSVFSLVALIYFSRNI